MREEVAAYWRSLRQHSTAGGCTHRAGRAAGADAWVGHLKSENIITDWRLLRRKFGLAAGQHTDFLIEIEVDSMSALEKAFSELSKMDDEHTRRYEFMHSLIGSMEVGLYRPYPDPEQRERIALL